MQYKEVYSSPDGLDNDNHHATEMIDMRSVARQIIDRNDDTLEFKLPNICRFLIT